MHHGADRVLVEQAVQVLPRADIAFDAGYGTAGDGF
jgi:hypothetical protein